MADYDFRGLSPIDFEALVRDLLSEETGLAFVTFAVGPDGGIDCRHTSADTIVVAQCKHRPDAKRGAMVSAAKAERLRLASKEGDGLSQMVDGYYFVTSATLSPDGIEDVFVALGSLVPDSGFVWTRGRLNQMLTKHPAVERRHFKLWLNSSQVFDRIMGSGEWERNEALVRGIKEHVEVWVHTPRYAEALEALQRDGVVIISGAPGVGKSTLAEMLLLTHWESGYKVVKITSDIADAWRHLRDGASEKVIFYYDDFLGQTSSLELQKNEGSDLGQIIRTLRKMDSRNALLVMTSREQILKAALHGEDDRISRAISGPESIRVELAEITRHERAQMLVNHIYFSYRDSGFMSGFADDTRYRKVIDHPGFNPRILEAVVLLKAPPSVDDLYSELFEALAHPEAIWSSSFHQLSTLASRIVMSLAIEPARQTEVASLERLVTKRDDPRAFERALRTLEGTWIRIDLVDGRNWVRLYDPSRRDFLLDQLSSGPILSETVRKTNSLQQLDLLVRHRFRYGAQESTSAPIQDIENCAVQLLSRSIEAATRAEAERADPGGGSHLSVEIYRDRMRALIASVEILSRLPFLSLLRDAVQAALGFMDSSFDWLHAPTSSAAFELASLLDEIDEDWAQERAEDCARVGVQSIGQTDEIGDYVELDWDLRRRISSPEIRSTLEQAMQHCVESVVSGTVPSVMLQELDDLEHFAGELDLVISTDTEREYVGSLPDASHERLSDAVQPLARPDAGSSSDEAIASLFSALRSGEG